MAALPATSHMSVVINGKSKTAVKEADIKLRPKKAAFRYITTNVE